jgi:hypothetical protein
MLVPVGQEETSVSGGTNGRVTYLQLFNISSVNTEHLLCFWVSAHDTVMSEKNMVIELRGLRGRTVSKLLHHSVSNVRLGSWETMYRGALG